METDTPQGGTVVLEIAKKLYIETDGTTTAWYQVLSLPELEGYGPRLLGLQVMTLTANRTANHQWKAVFEYSGDDKNWYPATPVDLCAWVTDDGTSRESATVSLWLILRCR